MNGALQQLIQSLEDDASLLNEDQLHRRLQVLDVLDTHFGTEFWPLRSDAEGRVALRERAEELSGRLEAVNATLYAGIRSEIQLGNGAAALLQWVSSETAAQVGREPVKAVGYDSLDELIRGVFAFEQPCLPPSAMHPEMVFYQPTPARHIFRLVELTALTGDDVLVDLGSGLGHVTLLVSVCTAARSVGVELEASYLACARQCAQRLHLRGVSFLQQDARSADPFHGHGLSVASADEAAHRARHQFSKSESAGGGRANCCGDISPYCERDASSRFRRRRQTTANRRARAEACA